MSDDLRIRAAMALVDKIARANTGSAALAVIETYRVAVETETQDALARVAMAVVPSSVSATGEAHMRSYQQAIVHAIRAWRR